jgi:outer membrane murein-binding lipoprotein Lpp
MKPLEERTAAERTRFLSREFLIGFIVNLNVLIGGGFYAFGRLEARAESTPSAVSDLQAKVAVLESKTIDVQRVAKLEQAMSDLEKSLLRVQAALDRNFYGESPKREK